MVKNSVVAHTPFSQFFFIIYTYATHSTQICSKCITITWQELPQQKKKPTKQNKKNNNKKQTCFFISLVLYTILGILMSFGFVFPKSKINDKSVLEHRSPDSESEYYSLRKCTQHAYSKELYAHWFLDLITA